MSIMAKVTQTFSPSKNWKKYWRYASSPRSYRPKSSVNVSSIIGQNFTANENSQIKQIDSGYHGTHSEVCRILPTLPEWRCIGPRYKIYRYQRAQYEASLNDGSVDKAEYQAVTSKDQRFDSQKKTSEENISVLVQCGKQSPTEQNVGIEETSPSMLTQCGSQPPKEQNPGPQEANPMILVQWGAQPPTGQKPRHQETNPAILVQRGAQPPTEQKPRPQETNPSILVQCGAQPPTKQKPRLQETNPAILVQCGARPLTELETRIHETDISMIPREPQSPKEQKVGSQEANPLIMVQSGAQRSIEQKPRYQETNTSILAQCEPQSLIEDSPKVLEIDHASLKQHASYSLIEVNQKLNKDKEMTDDQVSRKRPASSRPSSFLPSQEQQSSHQVEPKIIKLQGNFPCEGKAQILNGFDTKSEGPIKEAERKEPRPSLNDINLPVITTKNELRMFSDAKGKPVILGEGAFGIVRRGKVRIEDRNHDCVVKIFRPNKSSPQMILDEGRILHYLGNTGAVPKFFGLLESKDPKKLPSLVQECFAGGQDFCDLIDEDSTAKKDWMEICLNAAEGLFRIHSKGVIINDITEDNILVDNNNNVRFIDMGLATLDKGMIYTPGPELDRCVQIAPECKSGEETTFKSDIFSFGDVLRCIGEEEHIRELRKLSKSLTCPDPFQRIDLFETIKRLKQLKANV